MLHELRLSVHMQKELHDADCHDKPLMTGTSSIYLTLTAQSY